MTPLRRLVRTYPALAALIVALAVMLRVAVPAGFMPTAVDGRIVITICTGTEMRTMTMQMPGMDHQVDAAHHQDGAAKSPCAFADLALPVIGGADPIQLAAAIAFILTIALLRVTTLPTRRALRLRPPLRGPPLPA